MLNCNTGNLVREINNLCSTTSVFGRCVALIDSSVPVKSSITVNTLGMIIRDNMGRDKDDIVAPGISILGTEDTLGMMDHY